MKTFEITSICTGCKCCEAVCPKGAITFVADEEGFSIPQINQELCINCRLCHDRCPQNNSFHTDYQSIALGLKAIDKEVLKNTASGGVFAVLARTVVRNGGVAVGCAYDEDLVAKHIIIDKEQNLPLLYSSKYVQSDTRGVYSKVKILLESKRFVLFSGTGCQVAALRTYLNKKYDNLITSDIVCHGVPSPLLFKKYLGWLSKRYKTNIKHIEFRSKYLKGWGQTLCISTQRNKHYVFGRCDPYYMAYLSGKLHRYSCYECKYNRTHRASDFTMGDFWNILKCNPEFYDYWGVSEVIVNTQDGYDFLQQNLSQFDVLSTDLKTLEDGNMNLVRPDNMPEGRSKLKNLMKLSEEDLFKSSYFQISKVRFIKDSILFKIPVKIKTFLKKIYYCLSK